MERVFVWSQLFGVAGPKKILWKLYGVVIFALLLVIQLGAVYKLIKLLSGLTAYSVGNRSMTARLAGTIFYTSALLALVLSWRLSANWETISTEWALVERKSNMVVQPDKTVKRRMIVVMIVMTAFATLEHLMSILSQIEYGSSLSVMLETYILNSHGFILVPNDYSIWIAIPLFVMSNIATILWNLEDLLIVLISLGLSSRYQRLNLCVEKATVFDKTDKKWSKNTELLKVYSWRKIREAYVKQAVLVRRMDRALGGLIMLSSSGNFYFICLQLFLGITQGISGELIKRLYYMISLIWLIIRFSCVVLSASDVNVLSKKALRYLHGCSDKCYNIEIDRLQKQLTKDYVALSGSGFFYLDRSILLQMAAAIVTYELVLIQLDGKDGVAANVALNVTKT
ncbi:gustatory receptor for sugar taste 64a-like [Hyposmocoma kahamanoa]|uniref:gustatory receptor for sugar taste 64a-like n=1 Tax=Hyposmocoma kahamanoa TaxID=1477025 RepID=UPI000E6D80F1|nr:gustatory receptor for sugar taste 64a-like [Hyposmocoma kahamanoa]